MRCPGVHNMENDPEATYLREPRPRRSAPEQAPQNGPKAGSLLALHPPSLSDPRRATALGELPEPNYTARTAPDGPTRSPPIAETHTV